MVYFGISIGSSNVCLTVYKEGNCNVVANDAGDRVTPVCLALTNNETFVGITAKQQMVRNPQSVITHVLATLDGCVNGHSVQRNCKVISEGDAIHYEVSCEGKTRQITINQVLTLVFKKLLEIAQNQIEGDNNTYNVVLSVPQHFNDGQVKIIRSSASEAGFNVLDTINRPTASALAYGLGQSSSTDDMNLLFYRVGGISTDVCIVNLKSGMYFVGESLHKASLGGDYLTDLLTEYLLSEFKRMAKFDPSDNKRSMAKLRNAAENCKHVLSKMSTAHCFIESLYEGLDFSVNVSRARYDALISSHITSYIQPIHCVLETASIAKESISKIILCGGSLKTPKLQQAVIDLFPEAQVLFSLSPDEVIAQGAAMHAALIGEKSYSPETNMTDISVLTTSLYLKTLDENGADSYSCIIQSGTPVPARRQHSYKIASGVTNVKLDIYSRPNDCDEYSQVAQIVMNELGSDVEIQLTVHIRSDGSIHVSANENKDGQNESIVIPVEQS